MKTLIIIPSRLSATRLPGKPLLKINGLSIITHVFRKAVSANIGEVYVATEFNKSQVNHARVAETGTLLAGRVVVNYTVKP